MSKAAAAEEPQKFLKPGKVVIVLQGKHAGKKAIIVKNNDEGTKDRKYGYAILAGISSYPRKITKRMPKSKMAQRSKVKPFLRAYNYQHLMPTRYGVDLNLNTFSSSKTVADAASRKQAEKQLQEILTKRYLSGKNKWFFTQLKF